MVICALSLCSLPTWLGPQWLLRSKAVSTLTKFTEHHGGTICVKDLRVLYDRHPMLKTLGSLASFCVDSLLFKYDTRTGHTPATLSLLRTSVSTTVHDEVHPSAATSKSPKHCRPYGCRTSRRHDGRAYAGYTSHHLRSYARHATSSTHPGVDVLRGRLLGGAGAATDSGVNAAEPALPLDQVEQPRGVFPNPMQVTCYLGSMLQALLHLPTVQYELAQHQLGQTCRKHCVLCLLRHMQLSTQHPEDCCCTVKVWGVSVALRVCCFWPISMRYLR